MRRASLITFVLGLLSYPLAFYFSGEALGLIMISHGGRNSRQIQTSWVAGRVLAIASVCFLVSSVVFALAAKEARPRKRMWWVVPATVLAIAIAWFDWNYVWFQL